MESFLTYKSEGLHSPQRHSAASLPPWGSRAPSMRLVYWNSTIKSDRLAITGRPPSAQFTLSTMARNLLSQTAMFTFTILLLLLLCELPGTSAGFGEGLHFDEPPPDRPLEISDAPESVSHSSYETSGMYHYRTKPNLQN